MSEKSISINGLKFKIPKFYNWAPKEDIYNWAPKEDITAYELALCIPAFYMAKIDPSYTQHCIESLPPEAKRHFEES